MNKVYLMGGLGADPEVRATNGGEVCNMRMATSERWTDRNGEKQERTEWHRVVVYGRQAEMCSSLRKGSKVVVVGRLQTRDWEDKEGNKRQTTEIVAERIDPIARFEDAGGGGGGYSRGGNGGGGRSGGGGGYGKQSGGGGHGPDDDVPFSRAW